MNRLAAWLVVIRNCGWFVPSMTGGFPFPFAWQGWTAFVALLGALIVSMFLPGEPAMILRIVAIVCYIALSYWTLEPGR